MSTALVTTLVAGGLGVALWAGQIVTLIVAEVPGMYGRQFASNGSFKWWCHGLAPQGCPPDGIAGQLYDVGPFGLWSSAVCRLLFFVVPLIVLLMFGRDPAQRGVRAVCRVAAGLAALELLEHTIRVIVGAARCWAGGNLNSWCLNNNGGPNTSHLGISVTMMILITLQLIAFAVTYVAGIIATSRSSQGLSKLFEGAAAADSFTAIDTEAPRTRGTAPVLRATFTSGADAAAVKRHQ